MSIIHNYNTKQTCFYNKSAWCATLIVVKLLFNVAEASFYIIGNAFFVATRC